MNTIYYLLLLTLSTFLNENRENENIPDEIDDNNQEPTNESSEMHDRNKKSQNNSNEMNMTENNTFQLHGSRKSPHNGLSGPENILTGATPKLKDVWVYKVDNGNVNIIMKYLKDRNIKVGKVIRTSHVDAKYKSFKVRLYEYDLDKVLNKNFWPLNVNCKVWQDSNMRPRFKGRTITNNRYNRAF